MINSSQDQLNKLRDILTKLDESLLNKDAENRRRQPRVAMRIPLGVLLLTGHATSNVDVFTRNVSASGMGFVSRRLFRDNERIVVPFRIPKLPAKLVLARVTFGRYLQGGFHEMGSEFLEAISDIKGNTPVPDHWFHAAQAARNNPTPPPAPTPKPKPKAPPAAKDAKGADPKAPAGPPAPEPAIAAK